MGQKKKLTVVKVGGKILEEESTLAALLERFAKIEGAKVLVHGGGRSATQLAGKLGVETKMIDGRRVTDDEMLRIVTMVYGGLINKTVVARLQALGVNALGMTGADLNIIRSHRRPVKDVDYGWVGDVDKVDGEMLAALIEKGVVPIVAPLTHDGEGHMLNTNADTMAGETALGLVPYYDVELVFCFEKPGVLRDENDDESVVPVIDRGSFEALKSEGVITGGMIPKVENSLKSIEKGVKKVIITKSSYLGDYAKGTKII